MLIINYEIMYQQSTENSVLKSSQIGRESGAKYSQNREIKVQKSGIILYHLFYPLVRN